MRTTMLSIQISKSLYFTGQVGGIGDPLPFLPWLGLAPRQERATGARDGAGWRAKNLAPAVPNPKVVSCGRSRGDMRAPRRQPAGAQRRKLLCVRQGRYPRWTTDVGRRETTHALSVRFATSTLVQTKYTNVTSCSIYLNL